MKFTKLRIAGFKTFVEPVDFQIEPGLTGIVGPNGCGKSNLVEAMRWVMGENSSKNMRASGMDDVIFSGGGGRPARNFAEVALVLDNGGRTAPAAFNDCDAIEVSRRIERESGSTYRVNGRDVRAKDVQLLFADASTGARSPAMVRQGEIGQMIAAKPQERRRILEEAAGVAGLHSRRHEAELRLKAASDNLLRLDDILQQIETQARGLERQARQAARYRDLSAHIRRTEALLALINHREATEALSEAEAQLEYFARQVVERTRLQAEASRAQVVAADALPALREAEISRGGELQRLLVAREALDGEEKRASARSGELAQRIAQMTNDLSRERALIADAAGVLDRLDAEASGLRVAASAESGFPAQARARLSEAEATLAAAEAELGAAQDLRAQTEARRAACEIALSDERARLARIEPELASVALERAALSAERDGAADRASLRAALQQAVAAAEALEDEIAVVEAAHCEARSDEAGVRGNLTQAEQKAQRLETEAHTLSKLLNAASGGFWPPVTDEIAVAKGFEAALGAALGDDLDASTNPSAPAHWAETDRRADPGLPPGVEPLADLVSAPAALARRLNQIGLVLRAEGPVLCARLKPGQRLVSKEGDLWRWDGFVQAAEAPTPAARRLAEKNRLGDLVIEARAARGVADSLKRESEAAQAKIAACAAAESEARRRHKSALREVESAREKHAAAERAQAAAGARLLVLDEALQRLTGARDEARGKFGQAQAALENLKRPDELSERLDAARACASHKRAIAAEARAEEQTLTRNTEARAKRLEAIADERSSWQSRSEGAGGQISAFEARLADARAEHETLMEAPDAFLASRRALMNQIEAAEGARKDAADRRAAAEAAVSEADRAARTALEAMSAAREEKARSEARIEAARARCDEILRHIGAELYCAPDALAALANVSANDDLPAVPDIERRLEALKQDRERLGPVNLRAGEEMAEAEAARASLGAEHADLTAAIARLRQAIHSLNKDGRERLLAAFGEVNAHFAALFTTLFGGGAAELQLVESDDPLEAGLEILAHPPGKKPQAMTLLSGGEQALTALALIFAIFLTNPSPICVLDEVDAPLDDANVERFCDLLDEMAAKTATRFIAITHNPITMARMNRLFGVTMAERGVSQLVSVDLEVAERLLDAG